MNLRRARRRRRADKTTVVMISTLELTKAASQKEGSHYGATKGSAVDRSASRDDDAEG